MGTPYKFSTPSTWVVRTKCEAEDDDFDELIVRAFVCDAREERAGDEAVTVVQADHVQVVLPGLFYELERIGADSLIIEKR